MRTRYITPSVIFLMVLISTFVNAYQSDMDGAENRIYNVPDSPLKIRLTPDKEYLIFENYSNKTVKSYSLGCVLVENDKVSVNCEFIPEEVILAPINVENGELSFQSYGLSTSGQMFCEKTKAKLAVTKVMFDDGSKWQISDHTVPCNSIKGHGDDDGS